MRKLSRLLHQKSRQFYQLYVILQPQIKASQYLIWVCIEWDRARRGEDCYCGLQKCCENQIKRATHTQHQLLVSLPYKSYAYQACTYYFYFQNSKVLYLYYIIYLGQFLSVIGAIVAYKSL